MSNMNIGARPGIIVFDDVPVSKFCKTDRPGTVSMGEKVVTSHMDQDFCGCGGSTPPSYTRLTPIDKWYCKCSQNPYSG